MFAIRCAECCGDGCVGQDMQDRIGYEKLKIYFYIQFVILNKGYLKIKSVLFAG
jgi:hypothetical protein